MTNTPQKKENVPTSKTTNNIMAQYENYTQLEMDSTTTAQPHITPQKREGLN